MARRGAAGIPLGNFLNYRCLQCLIWKSRVMISFLRNSCGLSLSVLTTNIKVRSQVRAGHTFQIIVSVWRLSKWMGFWKQTESWKYRFQN